MHLAPWTLGLALRSVLASAEPATTTEPPGTPPPATATGQPATAAPSSSATTGQPATAAPSSSATATGQPATAAPSSSAQATEPAPAQPAAEGDRAEPEEPARSGFGSGIRSLFRRDRNRKPPTHPLEAVPDGRRFMIGAEGVVMSSPPIAPRVIRLDPRFVGRSVALGGAGLFGRFRPISFIGVDLGVRSGSLRYNARNTDASLSQDHLLVDLGALIYLGRGEIAQFALSGGLGGMWTRVGYSSDNGVDGVQHFGSAVFRVGGEAEFLVKRVAFILSFRMYSLVTDRDGVRNRGALLRDDPRADVAPVPTFQSMILGSAGVAYRF